LHSPSHAQLWAGHAISLPPQHHLCAQSCHASPESLILQAPDDPPGIPEERAEPEPLQPRLALTVPFPKPQPRADVATDVVAATQLPSENIAEGPQVKPAAHVEGSPDDTSLPERRVGVHARKGGVAPQKSRSHKQEDLISERQLGSSSPLPKDRPRSVREQGPVRRSDKQPTPDGHQIAAPQGDLSRSQKKQQLPRSSSSLQPPSKDIGEGPRGQIPRPGTPMGRQLPTGSSSLQPEEEEDQGEDPRGAIPHLTAWREFQTPLAYGMSLSGEQAGALRSATGLGTPWGENPRGGSFIAHAPVGFPLDFSDLESPPIQVRALLQAWVCCRGPTKSHSVPPRGGCVFRVSLRVAA